MRYLPGYSPDYNPIELAIGKAKDRLRRIKARTTNDLERAIPQAFATVTADDADAFFRHCGYERKDQPL